MRREFGYDETFSLIVQLLRPIIWLSDRKRIHNSVCIVEAKNSQPEST